MIICWLHAADLAVVHEQNVNGVFRARLLRVAHVLQPLPRPRVLDCKIVHFVCMKSIASNQEEILISGCLILQV